MAFTTALAVLVSVMVGVVAPPAAARTCGGGAYVFLRPNGANGLGHVGFGNYDCRTRSMRFGGIENPSGAMTIPAGHDNGYWSAVDTDNTTWNGLLAGMRARGYVKYKWTPVSVADPAAADAVEATLGGRGYTVVGNNCANGVYDVLHAYGVPWLPLLQTAPAPDDWYLQLSAPGTTWTENAL